MKERNTPPYRRALWLLILIIPLLLSACAGARTPSTSWPGLSVHEGTAFIAFNQAIYAVDAENGRELWRYFPEEDDATSFYAPPAIDPEGDLLFAGSFDGDVVALEQETGNIRWRQSLPGGRVIGGPTIAGDLLLVPSADRTLYALRLDSGQEVWSFSSERAFWARPYVEDEFVYVAGLDHFLYKLRANDGSVVWELELTGALADEPAHFNGLLLVGTFGQELDAVDKESGTVTWDVATSDWVWGNPAVMDGMAYFGDVAGAFYAVNEEGTVVWDFQVESQIAASPAIHDGNVYFVTEAGSVYARTAEDNTPVWQQDLEGRLLSDPIIVGGALLVAAVDGEQLLTAFDVESGAIRWTYQPVEE